MVRKQEKMLIRLKQAQESLKERKIELNFIFKFLSYKRTLARYVYLTFKISLSVIYKLSFSRIV